MAVLTTATAVSITSAILVAAGGVSALAETSVPGDALYHVKVLVNEEVRGGLAISNSAEATWEARLAIRRLQELQELAADAALTAETQAELTASFDAHAERARLLAADANASDDAGATGEVLAELDTELAAHAEALESLAQSKDTMRTHIRTSLVAIARVRSDIAQFSVNSSQGSSASSRAQESLTVVEDTYTRIDAQLENRQDLSAEVRAELEAKLMHARDRMVEVRSSIDGDAESETRVDVRSIVTILAEIEASLGDESSDSPASSSSQQTSATSSSTANTSARQQVDVRSDTSVNTQTDVYMETRESVEISN
ncbi:MAG: hypothetical protein Q7R81_00870 [Candidatus Peregrinibacteria bacterium]|nr:hypothetical protein [Candidatus Peregrinibacteria bacterium]